ncbi:MAG: uroporphyrinogen decarboxylase [Actinomycetota bacterium]
MAAVGAPARSSFLQTIKGEPSENKPVWFMRQAGRSLPEYRAIRERYSMQEVCRIPELAAEVTMQPVRRLGVDAAILFSDIMVPLEAAGIPIRFEDGKGPVIEEPIRTRDDLARLRPLDTLNDIPDLVETIGLLVRELDVPLIGFSGAPFTLASYLIEGGPSKAQARTRSLMLSEPSVWAALMSRLVRSTIDHLSAQIHAGAAAVQVFDSWAGSLSEDDHRRYVLPWVNEIMAGVAESRIPRIYFALGSSHLLPSLRDVDAEVVGIDWRTPLDRARLALGPKPILQGNLDPVALLATWPIVQARTEDVLRRSDDRHIFNLGHGVLPQTDPGLLSEVVALVHRWSR